MGLNNKKNKKKVNYSSITGCTALFIMALIQFLSRQKRKENENKSTSLCLWKHYQSSPTDLHTRVWCSHTMRFSYNAIKWVLNEFSSSITCIMHYFYRNIHRWNKATILRCGDYALEDRQVVLSWWCHENVMVCIKFLKRSVDATV